VDTPIQKYPGNTLEASLIGFYEGEKLKFVDRVGTGFSQKLLGLVFNELQKFRVESCPFSNFRHPLPTDGIKG
jgi:hypothetical protein